MVEWFVTMLDRSVQAGLAIILVLAIRQWGGLPPRWQYRLWLIPMARLILPWSVDTGISLEQVMTGIGHDPAVIRIAAGSAMADLGAGRFFGAGGGLRLVPGQGIPLLLLALTWLWGMGAAGMAVAVTTRSLLFLRQVRTDRQVVCERTLGCLERCRARMGVRTPLVVVETDRVSGPVLFGWLRPRILLPRGMARRMGPGALDAVFCHELGHLRQQDILGRYLMFMLLALHWFNPLAWVMTHLMDKDRERACDALALSTMTARERKVYGQVLVSLACPFSRALPGFAGIAESPSDIKRRIYMIAAFQRTPVRRTLALAAGFVLLTLGAFSVGPGLAGNPSAPDLPGLAGKLTTQMAAGDHGAVVRHFDATMQKALDADKLGATWDALVSQAGRFKQIRGTREAEELGYKVVYVACGFEAADMNLKFVFNDKARVSGFWILPPH